MAPKYLIDQTLQRIQLASAVVDLPLFKKDGFIHKYRIIYCINFICLNIELVGCFSWMVGEGRKLENVIKLLYDIPCFALSALSHIKALTFIYYRNTIHELISILRGLEVNAFKSKSKERYRIIKKDTDFINLLSNVLYYVNSGTLIAFVLLPLSLMVRHYFATKEIVPVLPFFIVYPFNPYELKIWPFVYLLQSWGATTVVLGMCVVDFTFYICCSYIRLQFKLLAHDVQSVVTHASTDCLYDEAVMKERCIYFIHWHQKLFTCVDLLEKSYSMTTLLNVVVSSANLCLTSFNVVNVGDPALTVSFAAFLCMSLLQIFFVCLFGDMVMRSSEAVSDAIYKCKWYLVDKSTALMLYTILNRAQKPCKVTAHGFADINLHAFTTILSTSWSYFALLNTVYKSTKSYT